VALAFLERHVAIVRDRLDTDIVKGAGSKLVIIAPLK